MGVPLQAMATKFHESTHYADPSPDNTDGKSWWCGELNGDFAGGDGYGNLWCEYLLYEDIDVSNYAPGNCLVLTFHGRYDSENSHDFTYVQAFNAYTSTWEKLNPGYSGSSGGWFDIGNYGFILEGSGCGSSDDYIQIDGTVDFRFLFVSDSGWSDEDGLYDSDGGGFSVDGVKVFEFPIRTVYLLEWDQSVGVPGTGDLYTVVEPGAWGQVKSLLR
jgi:hypothetical protein